MGEPLTSDPQKANASYQPGKSWNKGTSTFDMSYIAPNPQRIWKQVIIEFENTMAKRLVEGLFSPRNVAAGGPLTANTYDFWSDWNDFFAIGMLVCPNCFLVAPKKWCYPSGPDDKPGISNQPHSCDLSIISALQSGIIEIENVGKTINALLPQNLSLYVNMWLAGRSIRLRAIEIPNPLLGHCVFHDPQRPDRSITLEITRKDWISVDATGSDKAHYHSWAARASADKDIALGPLEVTDFLNLCLHSTFSFFSVDTLEGTKKYLMALYPADQLNTAAKKVGSVSFQRAWSNHESKGDENKNASENAQKPTDPILQPQAVG